MQLLKFIEDFGLQSLKEAERAKMLCYYCYKESGKSTFSNTDIVEMFSNAGYNVPNTSRLRNNIIKGQTKTFILSKTTKGSLEFAPAILQALERDFGQAWNDNVTIESDSELIDEVKFCGKRTHLTRLIEQINSSYKHNCYDACAVLMRRLFEVLLILSYEKLSIDSVIKENGNYSMLEKIVKNAQNNTTLKLSRNKDEYDKFRKTGNFSAHSITYTASKKDIDDIKAEYRVMLEELYNKAGLI
ncbi:MAG: hypothetical protein FWD34_10330 [Oscillospiraceae bacterium]|nr:hypothetical protein [Oscillospiraceae bacterium]